MAGETPEAAKHTEQRRLSHLDERASAERKYYASGQVSALQGPPARPRVVNQVSQHRRLTHLDERDGAKPYRAVAPARVASRATPKPAARPPGGPVGTSPWVVKEASEVAKMVNDVCAQLGDPGTATLIVRVIEGDSALRRRMEAALDACVGQGRLTEDRRRDVSVRAVSPVAQESQVVAPVTLPEPLVQATAALPDTSSPASVDAFLLPTAGAPTAETAEEPVEAAAPDSDDDDDDFLRKTDSPVEPVVDEEPHRRGRRRR